VEQLFHASSRLFADGGDRAALQGENVMNLAKFLGAALALSLAATGCASTAHSNGPSTTGASVASAPRLDGQRYKVVLSAGDKKMPDELTFDHGSFDSSACRGFGFGPAGYTVRGDGDAIEFQVDAHSKDTINHWHGRIVGHHVSGTVTEERNGTPGATYAFEGDEG
jgi:hypothetical protein